MARMRVRYQVGSLTGPGYPGTCVACWDVPTDELREGGYVRAILTTGNRNQHALVKDSGCFTEPEGRLQHPLGRR